MKQKNIKSFWLKDLMMVDLNYTQKKKKKKGYYSVMLPVLYLVIL